MLSFIVIDTFTNFKKFINTAESLETFKANLQPKIIKKLGRRCIQHPDIQSFIKDVVEDTVFEFNQYYRKRKNTKVVITKKPLGI